MTSDHQSTEALLAAYALDAVDVDEVLAIESHLDRCADCRAALAQMRETVELLAALPAATPPDDLRPRTVAAALARRAARPLGFTPAELHLIESSRLVALLGGLAPDQWRTPIGPVLPDWNVQDLAAHLIASEVLLAAELGIAPSTPEVEDQPTARTHPTVERHRHLPTADTLAELEATYTAVQRAVGELGPRAADRVVSWFGIDMALGHALTQRAFEIWTHADDMRAALGVALVPPPAPSLQAMSATAIETVPILLAAGGIDGEGRRARITLVGPGGATYEIDLGLEARPSPGDRNQPDQPDQPDVILQLDVVEFCRGLADRLPADRTHYRATGDTDLAARLVASLPALAVL